MIPGKSKNILRQLKIGNILSEDNDNDNSIIKENKTFTTNLVLSRDQEKALYGREVENSVSNYIFKYLEKNAKIINISLSDIRLMETRKQNLVTNGNLGSIMQDYKEYKFLEHESDGNLYYILGKWKDSKYYINPYLLWTDNKILCFDNYGFYDYKATYDNKIIPSSDFVPRFNVSLDIYIDTKILNNLKMYDFADAHDALEVTKLIY